VYRTYIPKTFTDIDGTSVGATFSTTFNKYKAPLMDLHSLDDSFPDDLSGIVYIPGTTSPGTTYSATLTPNFDYKFKFNATVLNQNIAYTYSMTNNKFDYKAWAILLTPTDIDMGSLDPLNNPYKYQTTTLNIKNNNQNGASLYMRVKTYTDMKCFTPLGGELGSIASISSSGPLQNNTWGFFKGTPESKTDNFNPLPDNNNPVKIADISFSPDSGQSITISFGALIDFETPACNGYKNKVEYSISLN
jgi:hypothetical protein